MEDELFVKVLHEDSVLVEDRRCVRTSLDGVSSFGISQDGCGLVMRGGHGRTERDEGLHLI